MYLFGLASCSDKYLFVKLIISYICEAYRIYMEPSLSSVPSSLWSIIKNKLEEQIFLPAYKISHQNYLKHKHQACYASLARGIEYDLFLECKHVSNEELPLSKLYLKVEASCHYRELTGRLIVKSDPFIYQEVLDLMIEVDRGSSSIIVCHLPNIPLKEVHVVEGGFLPSIREIKFVGMLTDEHGQKEEFEVNMGLPLYDESFNDDWDIKWGSVWCLSFINQEFSNFRHKCICNLAGSFALLNVRAKHNESIGYKLRRCWYSFVVAGLCNERLLLPIWWMTMKLRIKSLQEKANLN